VRRVVLTSQPDLRDIDDSTLALMRFEPYGQTLLHLAATGDADVTAVKQLMAIHGVDLNAADAAGRTPLAVAGKVLFESFEGTMMRFKNAVCAPCSF
jgi:hypothetical protein